MTHRGKTLLTANMSVYTSHIKQHNLLKTMFKIV